MRKGKTVIGRLAAVLGGAALVVAAAGASAQSKKELVWSVHVDITGPASYSGAQQAAGFKDYVAWKNTQGGIRGRKIRLILTDTTFKPAVAVAGFKKVLAESKPVYVSGDGTAMIKAITPENNSTHNILMTSGSFATQFDNPKSYPYHFMGGPSYGDMMEILLIYIKQQHKGAGKPSVAIVHSNLTFGRDPIQRAREVAKRLGIEVKLVQQTKFNEAAVGPFSLAIRRVRPDYVIFHGYAFSVWPEIMRQVQDYGLKSKFMGTVWAMDRAKVAKIGPAADGYMGVQPFPYKTTDVKGSMMKVITELHKKKNPKYDGYAQLGYMQSWMNAMIATKAIELTLDAGKEPNAKNMAMALRNLKNWDTGGLYGKPVSFRGQKIGVGRIYRFNAKKDWTPEPISDWIEVK